MAAVEGLIAAIHLNMQLAIDTYLAALQEKVHEHAVNWQEEIAVPMSQLTARAEQFETLYG